MGATWVNDPVHGSVLEFNEINNEYVDLPIITTNEVRTSYEQRVRYSLPFTSP
jgi:hypothetical protein